MNEKEILETLNQFLLDCYNNWEINSMEELYQKAEGWQCDNPTFDEIVDDYWIHQLVENFADDHWLFMDEDNAITYEKFWNILSDKLNELAEKDWYFNS